MRWPSEENLFFLFGLLIVVGLVIYHYDASIPAGLVGGHKFVSVLDGKITDKN